MRVFSRCWVNTAPLLKLGTPLIFTTTWRSVPLFAITALLINWYVPRALSPT